MKELSPGRQARRQVAMTSPNGVQVGVDRWQLRKTPRSRIASACEEQTALNFGMVCGKAFGMARLENNTALPNDVEYVYVRERVRPRGREFMQRSANQPDFYIYSV